VTPGWLRRDGDAWILAVRVQPRAARDEIAGVTGERLKIRITAPPADGRANEHLRRWLSDFLRVSRAQVVLEQGASSRDKRLRINGVPDLPAILLRSTKEPTRKT
jgi:uncharacterized protein (TIGR00251 family)